MFEWLAEQFGDQTALIIYYFIIFVALIIAVIFLRWIWKSISGGTFVHGGKDQRRLAVVDATAVDNRRRLVLVRRDNVEHLVMIGGMSDVLIESNIGQPKKSVEAESVEKPEKARPAEKRKVEPQAAAPVVAAAVPERPEAPAPQAKPEPVVAAAPDVSPQTPPTPTVEPQVSPIAPKPSPAARPEPPAPFVKQPQNSEPSFEVAEVKAASEYEFDLDISANDLTVAAEKPKHTANTFEPSVDFPSDSAKAKNDDAARKPLEDEMEALLNKLTGPEK